MENEDDDPDAATIARVVDAGSDISRPMIIDFSIIIREISDFESVKTALTTLNRDYEFDVFEYEEMNLIDVIVSKEMLLNFESIINEQFLINDALIPLGLETDGWGTFGNAPEN